MMLKEGTQENGIIIIKRKGQLTELLEECYIMNLGKLSYIRDYLDVTDNAKFT